MASSDCPVCFFKARLHNVARLLESGSTDEVLLAKVRLALIRTSYQTIFVTVRRSAS